MRGNGRLIRAAVASTAAGCSVALAATWPGAGAAQAVTTAALARSGPAGQADGTEPVIIFLKKQVTGAGGATIRSSQRSALLQAAQAPVVGQLQQLGATKVHGFLLANAVAARVPRTAVSEITGNPGVAAVIPDSPIIGPGTGAATAAAKARPTAMKTPAGACSSTPQVEPEGLGPTNTVSAAKGATTARSLGYTGSGVRVAFLADGIDPANANLVNAGKSKISDYKDFSGDGRDAATAGGEAFMDANAIAGQGSQVYNVAGFSAQVPDSACKIKIDGVAPGASLVALKVFSKNNVSTTSAFLQAIDYAVYTDHVNVLNESFGANPFPDVTSLDVVKQFNDTAVAAGITVVVAGGDAGPFNTIGSPAADPAVISVGASTDFRFYAQTNYAGADKFAPNGWESGNVSALSSGGYTQDGRTLDLVAPGDMSFASCTPSARFSSCVNFLGKPSTIEQSGGTSQAAPLVAGAAALVIQAYAKAHGGTRPTPTMVKQMLTSSATDLGAPATEQGAGMLNTLKAVELAAWTPARPGGPGGPAVQLSQSQLDYAGAPGTTAAWPLTVTNTSKSTEKLSLSGRTFGASTTVNKGTVTLSDAKSPRFTNWAGTGSNYASVRFTVPSGQATLNSSIAWPAKASQASSQNARVRLILVNPSGKLAAHSAPQGESGYGSAQVLHPKAGRWTAVIFSDTAAAGGTAGKVQFAATVAKTARFGTVSPSTLTLGAGKSVVVHMAAKVPAGAGDSSGSLVVSGAGSPASVPVTLRGQVQTGAPGTAGRFSGVLTGGNGRAPGEGQVASYSFVVPGNLPVMLRNIDVDVTLANDPANQVSAYLIAPGGETMGYGSSFLTTGFTGSGVPVETPGKTLSLYTSNPIPGAWTLIVDFTSPVPGDELADPFTGKIRYNAASFDRGGLPDSPASVLPAGVKKTYKITVHNTGAAPQDIFLDPRLVTMESYALQPQDKVANVRLPMAASADPPEWIVPTMTQAVGASATSSRPAAPIMFDFGPFPGDPDEASSTGTTASAYYPLGKAVTPVTQGLWFTMPSQVGPFPAGGSKGTTVTSSMSVTTQAFDTHMASSTGDFWKFGIASLAGAAKYNLFVVKPGQTRTVTLTVKPEGAKGTVVKGMLYIDDFVDSLQFLSGSQLVALPYQYTIG